MMPEAEFEQLVDRVRAIVARFPEVTERASHSAPSFFVREKKTLANVWNHHHDDGRVAIWAAAGAGVQAELVELEPERFFVPPYVGHRGWLGVRLDVAPDWDEIAKILEDAYRLVAPKTLIKQLDEAQ